MVFASLHFLFMYLPCVLLLYYISPLKWRNALLLVVNLVFYGWGEPVYILLMLFSIVVNYISGLFVEKYRLVNDKKAKTALVVNTVINLGMLFFFKYYDFLAVNLSKISFLSFIKPIGLSLPLGISFYTFQSLSYSIDVYRGDAGVQRNFVNFGAFVSLFPQLTAGPIVRYKNISNQLSSRNHSVDLFAFGIRRFIVGLGKKVLLANSIGLLWDATKATPSGELTVLGAWLGILAYTLYIYFDFSGYSDMAIGLGRMLGFELLENFNYPYISKSITEFWRRWHISLSTWFRDYVYIPLGGNRRGIARQFFNIFIVWMLTGIWHGASWNFLIWGVYYAVLLMLEKAFLLRVLERIPKILSHIYALFFIILGWLLFSIEDMPSMLAYFGAMFGANGAGLVSTDALFYLETYLPSLVLMCIAATPFGKKLAERLNHKVAAVLIPILIVIVLVLSTAYLVDSTYSTFLYFRF